MKLYHISHEFMRLKKIILIALNFFFIIQVSAQTNDPQFKLAEALEKSHDYNESLKIYYKLYVRYPNSPAIIGGIKRCYSGLQEYKKLILFLTDIVNNSGDKKIWQIDLAEAYLLDNQKEKALEIWQAQIDMAKGNINIYRLVALAMIRQRLYDEAINVYFEALNNIQGQYNLHIEIANLYKIQLEYGKATEHYLQYYLYNPKQKSFIERQILNMTDGGQQITAILNTINKFLDAHPEQLPIYEVKAGIYIKEKNFEKAFYVYKDLEITNKTGKYFNQFALEAFKNDAYEYTISSYKMLLNTLPNSPYKSQALYHMARAYSELAYQKRKEFKSDIANNYMSEAMALLDNLISSAQSSKYYFYSYIILGDIYFQFYYDLDRAIESYKMFIEKYPENKLRDEVLIKLGDVYLTKNQIDKAKNTYARVQDKDSKYVAQFKICDTYYYQGKFSLAASEYDKLLMKIGTANPISNDILSRQLLLKSYSQDSLMLLKYAQAELLVFQNKLSEASEKLYALSTAQLAISPLAGKYACELLYQLERFIEAKELLYYLRKSFPDNDYIDEVIFLLACTEQKLKNYHEALNLFKELFNQYKNSFFVKEARERAREINALLEKEHI